jgi:hypothetical protein
MESFDDAQNHFGIDGSRVMSLSRTTFVDFSEKGWVVVLFVDKTQFRSRTMTCRSSLRERTNLCEGRELHG